MKTFFAFVKQHVFPAVVAMTLSLLLGLSEWMQNVENMTLDLRTKSRVLWQPAMADPQQLVVSIDEESLGAYKAWPWPRRVHGLFLALVGADDAVGDQLGCFVHRAVRGRLAIDFGS